MADTPDIVGLDPRDAPDFVGMMGDYRASRLRNPTAGSRWPNWHGRDGGKLFARPITSQSDATPATHAAGTTGWFQPENGPAHASPGTDTGDPKQAWPLVTCNAGNLCVLERIGGRWYAVEICT